MGVSTAELATESEFQGKFPGCEVGAMPPFGNLYGMDVHVSKRLMEDKEITFNADFHGAKSLNVSLWDYPGFARKFGKFATETLIGL
ncbi:MAG TPA: YbaK/EbsC family protein, partial [Gammaproteobacteria bacterium]|nr:YbaK/EbsC family protein [Gammaproteobacteria bacterium]